MGLSFDPKNEYSLPYQWGTTGILYNKKETGELDGTWDPMWDPQFEGQIAMLADSRETLGAALYKLGYSVNSKDDAELSEAEAELKKQQPLLLGYFISTEVRPLVQNGDIALGHVYSGDAFLALAGNEDLDYIIPQPQASRWTDNMCIPNGAPHPDNAHKFIDHILGADVGRRSPTTPTTTRPPCRAARYRSGAEGPSRLHPAAGDIREAGGHRGRRGEDPRVRAYFTEVRSA